MAKINGIRFCNRIDYEENWDYTNPILEYGEIGIVINSSTNTPIMLFIGNGTDNYSTLISDTNNVVYSGEPRVSITLPIATNSTIGAVKVAESTISGLTLSTSGSLSNAMTTGLDENDYWVIENLKVKNLIADSQQTVSTFSGDTIELRGDEPLSSDAFAGLIINSATYEKIDDETYSPLKIGVFYNHFGWEDATGVHFPVYISGMGDTTKHHLVRGDGALIPIQAIAFTTSREYIEAENEEDSYWQYNQETYDGTGSLELDLIPYDIEINGQKFTRDTENYVYSIEMDGGLSASNIALLNSVDKFESRLTTLEDSAYTVESGKLIDVSKKDSVVTISHSEIGYEIDSPTALVLKDGSEFTVITNITVDDYGHVTKITKQKYRIEL